MFVPGYSAESAELSGFRSPGVTPEFSESGAAKGLKEVLAKRAGCMHRGTGHVLCPPLGSCEAGMRAIDL